MWKRFRRVKRSLWETGRDAPKGFWVGMMRIAAITYRGVFDNRLFSRAAALSYSSLLALGPIVGIIVLLTGTFMRGDPEEHIKRALLFIAPTMAEYVNLEKREMVEAETEAGRTKEEIIVLPEKIETPADVAALPPEMRPDTDPKPLPPEVSESDVSTALDVLIDRMIAGANETIGNVEQGGKGIFGAIGGMVLIWIGITLLVAVENAFNEVWGVRQGRAWGHRIVFYWAVLSLGALIGFALIGILSATTVAGLFNKLPYGATLSKVMIVGGPVVSFLGLTGLLTLFYQFFPNTSVRFRPAATGAVVVAVLLVTNQLLSILYIRQVVRIQSLYGSVGIILVLMIGLYFFWVFLLLGGQLTYATQNVSFLANQRAWNNVSLRTRETITFATYIVICRRFSNCLPPLSADEIADIIRVPTNIVNESLTRLCELNLLTALREREDDAAERACFLPARPLNKITLAKFREVYTRQGSDEGADLVRGVDPLIEMMRDRLDSLEDEALSNKTIDDLLEEYKVEPPLHEDERRQQERDLEEEQTPARV